ncbi:hypothetical protein [Streptomyces niveus]|uniref:hypothetical protein n=1 Tax=Streptomyces niveus TaxID=193462 RepID=UPI0036C5A6D1
MGVHPDVEVLLDLVPADLAGGEQIGWVAAEASLGVELPSDYKALPDTYGVGDIDGSGSDWILRQVSRIPTPTCIPSPRTGPDQDRSQMVRAAAVAVPRET